MENKDKHIDKLPDFLSKMKDKKEGYNVPFNYFENLENSIMDNIYEENRLSEAIQNQPSFWQRIFAKKTPIYAFASLLLIVGVFYGLQNNLNVSPSEDLLTSEIAEIYLEDNIDDFSFELITEELTEQDTEDLDISEVDINTEEIPESYWDDINDTNIEDYL